MTSNITTSITTTNGAEITTMAAATLTKNGSGRADATGSENITAAFRSSDRPGIVAA